MIEKIEVTLVILFWLGIPVAGVIAVSQWTRRRGGE